MSVQECLSAEGLSVCVGLFHVGVQQGYCQHAGVVTGCFDMLRCCEETQRELVHKIHHCHSGVIPPPTRPSAVSVHSRSKHLICKPVTGTQSIIMKNQKIFKVLALRVFPKKKKKS